MKILSIVESPHQGNTLKVAQAMAEAAPMDIISVSDAPEYNLRDYDIVGFGSGIYFGKHDKRIMELADKFCDDKAYTFVFSTSGSSGFMKNNKALADLLKSKNKVVLGSFGCKGLDKFSVFKLLGGLNKGRPNKSDLKEAQKFILNVVKNYERSEAK